MGVVYCGVSLMLWLVSFVCLSSVCVVTGCKSFMFCLDWSVMSSSSEVVEVGVVVDLLSLSYVGVVCLVSGSVFLYSLGYMSGLEESCRFLMVLLLFVGSMCLLVFIPSVLGLIIGWDGLGVSSFLLVVYYQNSGSLSSGMITALTNRVGDGLIVVSMAFSLVLGHWSLFFGAKGVLWLSFLLGVASMTKSAQMPFCSWLPAAMAAPTPVSSLVHSSTLVTAGNYLLVRFSKCLSQLSFWDDFLVTIGCLTMIVAGVSGVFESDMKKVVAMSTLSQLGMMFFVLGMGFPWLCLFHVYMHALFKAMLFMGVGSIIHMCADQNIFKMGGLWWSMPVSSGFIVLSCFCLMGLPFLSGFFSKDLIVEACLNQDLSIVLSIGLIVGISLTVLYSVRLCVCIMSDVSSRLSVGSSGESKVMIISMMILSVGAVMGGSLGMNTLNCVSVICMEVLLKLAPLIVVSLVFTLSFFIFFISNSFESKVGGKNVWFSFVSQMWFLPLVSGEVSSSLFGYVGGLCVESLEYGWMETLGGQGVSFAVSEFLKVHQRMQNLDLSRHFVLMCLTTLFWLVFLFIGMF